MRGTTTTRGKHSVRVSKNSRSATGGNKRIVTGKKPQSSGTAQAGDGAKFIRKTLAGPINM